MQCYNDIWELYNKNGMLPRVTRITWKEHGTLNESGKFYYDEIILYGWRCSNQGLYLRTMVECINCLI